jgi:iron complex outermembrane recepter protein
MEISSMSVPANGKNRRSNPPDNLIRNFVHIAILAGLATGGAAQAQQAPANTSDNGPIQEVVVTGSLIKRTDTETPSPVQVLTATDLQNSGYTNVAEVLQNVSANGAGSLNQAFGQAFAAGASGIALRGLTVGATLTLIDGERMVPYPLSDDGERSFVDVTAIPFNAIDSVEVLKDGASSIYGADAIAGVVNIKLKKTYVGSEITAEGGTTQHGDGTSEHFAGIVGFGDLNSDGYNVYAAIDYHHTDKILDSSRDGAFTTTDWSGLPGGVNTAPGSISGSNLSFPDSLTGYVLNPSTTNGLPAETFLPGCTAAAQAANECTFKFPGLIQAPSSQLNFLSKLSKSLGNDWSATLTVSVFDSKAQQVAPTSFGHAFPQTGQENGSIVNVAFAPGLAPGTAVYPVLSLPATSPLNPYGAAANLVYSFGDVGPTVTDVETTTYRIFTDLNGSVAGWDIHGDIGVAYAKMYETYYGLIEPVAAQNALNSGAYVPGVSTNGASLFAPPASVAPSSSLGVVDANATRELFQLPGGPLSIGIGAQYKHEALNATNPENVATGVQNGAIAFAVGSQDSEGAFLELDAQPIKSVEANAAIRYDHYDTYGGSATPKLGLKWTPIDMLAFRGTWGKGFRAPSIAESGDAGITFGANLIPDPTLCPGGVQNVKGTFNSLCAFPAVFLEPANPTLKAVTSTNSTFGVVFEPFHEFNASVDWYHIVLTNDIISAGEFAGLGDTEVIVRGAPAQQLVCTNTVTSGTCAQALATTPVGYPAYLEVPYFNAGATKTSGLDFDLRGRVDLGDFGKIVPELQYTYITQYEIEIPGAIYNLAGTHGNSEVSGDTGNPRMRAVASLSWQRGPASLTATINYRGQFNVTDPSNGLNSCLSALSLRGSSAYGAALSGTVTSLPAAWQQYCNVPHFTDVNLHAAYQVTDKLNVHLSITNLLNTQPPVDLQTYGGGGQLAYTTLDQDGAVGRFFMAGASYKIF